MLTQIFAIPHKNYNWTKGSKCGRFKATVNVWCLYMDDYLSFPVVVEAVVISFASSQFGVWLQFQACMVFLITTSDYCFVDTSMLCYLISPI